MLVKKLAKRPVNRGNSGSNASVTFRPLPPPPPPDLPKRINSSIGGGGGSDHCASSDIDCGGGGGGDGSVEPRKLLDFLRGEVWVIPLLVSACALAAVLVVFEIYLVSKSLASTPSRRHLFLGQTLMLGLVLCCATAAVISLKPTPALCAASRVGIGLSYTVVYSTLLVKLVFLISLNSGVYLPATYQGLLLCFAVLIQVVIGVQWLVSSPATVLHLTMESGEVVSSCDVTFRQHILGLLYVIFLVAVVVVLAFKSRWAALSYIQ